jgi:hypothetical protein
MFQNLLSLFQNLLSLFQNLLSPFQNLLGLFKNLLSLFQNLLGHCRVFTNFSAKIRNNFAAPVFYQLQANG